MNSIRVVRWKVEKLEMLRNLLAEAFIASHSSYRPLEIGEITEDGFIISESDRWLALSSVFSRFSIYENLTEAMEFVKAIGHKLKVNELKVTDHTEINDIYDFLKKCKEMFIAKQLRFVITDSWIFTELDVLMKSFRNGYDFQVESISFEEQSRIFYQRLIKIEILVMDEDHLYDFDDLIANSPYQNRMVSDFKVETMFEFLQTCRVPKVAFLSDYRNEEGMIVNIVKVCYLLSHFLKRSFRTSINNETISPSS